MSNYKFYFLLATSSLIILLFSCKRKNDITDEIPKSGVITATSFALQDFVIHDAADARVLDFLDVHRIVQEADTTKVRNGAVDTLYFTVLESIDITSLKLKPRFSDLDRVVSIDPDTTQARDFSNNGIEYPTMKVKFNTGLTRTFAIVVSKTAPNQNNINLLLNQHTYYLSEYKVYNDDNTNITSQTKIKLTNHLPILLQTSAEDTIEFSVVYNNVVGNNIYFTPLKYGDENTDTVITTTSSTELVFDKTNPTDLATYKTMTITFANGFVRNYAVKPIVIDNNENLNKNAYIIGMYDFKSGGVAITNLSQVNFTQHTPTNRIMQRDTIDVTVPSTFAGTSVDFSVTSYGLVPDNYTANDSVKTTVRVAGVAHDGVTALAVATGTGVPANALVIPNTEFGNYVTITYTFSNGFKREYAVRVTKALPTDVNFTTFSVVESGITCYDKDTVRVVGDSSLFLKNNGRIILVRPLTGWDYTSTNPNRRKVTLNFTGITPNISGLDITYKVNVLNSDGTLGANLVSGIVNASGDVSIPIDFVNVASDSVKLTFTNTNPSGGKSKEYTIKLLSGINYKAIQTVIDASGTKDRYTLFFPNPTDKYYDKELGIAVDSNNVYVLKFERNNATTAAPATANSSSSYPMSTDFFNGTTTIYAYSINTTTNIATTTPAAVVMPTEKVCAIFAVGNILYGLALDLTNVATPKHFVYKWSNGIGNPPTKLNPTSIGNATHIFTSVYPILQGNTIELYCTPIGGNLNKPTTAAGTGSSYFKISISSSDVVSTLSTGTKIQSEVAMSIGVATGATGSIYINNKNISLVICSAGLLYYPASWKVNASDSFKATYLPRYTTDNALTPGSASNNINLIGGDIKTIRENDYLLATQALIYDGTSVLGGQGGAIFDFGKNIKNTFDGFSNTTNLYNYRTKFFPINTANSSFANLNYYNRGSCRTYGLGDGRVRVAYLVNGSGFVVYDLK